MDSRKIARNTYLYRVRRNDNLRMVEGVEGPPEDCFELVLHSTPVLRFWPDGSVEYDSGSWRTKVTRDRMDYAANLYVFTAKLHARSPSSWWIGRGYYPNKNNWVPFFDGVRVNQETGEALNSHAVISTVMDTLKPSPTTTEQITRWMDRVLTPESLSRIATTGSTGFRPSGPVALHGVLLCGFLDLYLLLEAITHDAARTGDVYRNSARALFEEWVPLMERGKEPHRIRTTLRHYLAQFAGSQEIILPREPISC